MARSGRTVAAGMTSRERIMAALNREPVDHMPFVPLMDWYTIMDMPAALVSEAQALGYNRGLLHVSRQAGVDIMLRHVPVLEWRRDEAPFLCSLGGFREPVKASTEWLDATTMREVLETPVGTLSGTYGFTDRVGLIPHPLDHFVNTPAELEIFHYAVEHLSEEPPRPAHDGFRRMEEELGEDGVATTSFSNTPLMYLIEMVWGLESTCYLLHDHPDTVVDILERLHQAQKRAVIALAEGPAEVVISYENTSSTLLSPAMFRTHCLPFLDTYADILAQAGKIYLVHACGKLAAFTDDLGSGRFAGVFDIAPPPTGDLPLDEAVLKLGGKVVAGGIDATTFVSSDDAAVEASVTGLIERCRQHRGVLLGSADTAPRGTTLERLRQIQNLVETAGAYA